MKSGICDRAIGAFVGLAIGDALGAPVEFKPRGSFPLVTDMQGGGYFQLPAGAWTDDTAMALCLADSLLCNPTLDVADMLDRFLRWMDVAENTSTGRCIGVGQNSFAVLGNYRRTGALIAPRFNKRADGNGALMRLAPVACRHWADIAEARRIAKRQSEATHCSPLSAAACEFLVGLLANLIGGCGWQAALDAVVAQEWPEELAAKLGLDLSATPESEIRSTGYVLDTLSAALWSVMTTTNFEDALIRAVNLGDDADTVGAVTGQIAGARYGMSAIPKKWLDKLIKADMILERASQISAAGLAEERGSS